MALDGFKKYFNDNQKYLDKNSKGEDTSYLVSTTQHIKNELVQMIDYTKTIYDYEDALIPYQELRYKLITHNIPGFTTTANIRSLYLCWYEAPPCALSTNNSNYLTPFLV